MEACHNMHHSNFTLKQELVYMVRVTLVLPLLLLLHSIVVPQYIGKLQLRTSRK
jgi:hypothetical protein